jgi:hypothetical protein
MHLSHANWLSAQEFSVFFSVFSILLAARRVEIEIMNKFLLSGKQRHCEKNGNWKANDGRRVIYSTRCLIVELHLPGRGNIQKMVFSYFMLW